MFNQKSRVKGPFLVAITGTLGSGKSSVLSILKGLGYPCIDVDSLARRILHENKSVVEEVKSVFGPDIVDEQGGVDRGKLRSIIINDPGKRKRLEEIIHPRVMELLNEHLNALIRNLGDNKDKHFIFVEVPLLYEAGWEPYFDSTVCVVTSKEQAISRVVQRHGVDFETAVGWHDLQWPIDEKTKRADFIVNNEGSLEDLKQEVQRLLVDLERKHLVAH